MGTGMAGVCGLNLVSRASGSASASTKVKEDSVDSEEDLMFSNSKVETVDSDSDPGDDWERSGSGNSTGLGTMSSPVIPSGLVEESPFKEPMA